MSVLSPQGLMQEIFILFFKQKRGTSGQYDKFSYVDDHGLLLLGWPEGGRVETWVGVID